MVAYVKGFNPSLMRNRVIQGENIPHTTRYFVLL